MFVRIYPHQLHILQYIYQLNLLHVKQNQQSTQLPKQQEKETPIIVVVLHKWRIHINSIIKTTKKENFECKNTEFRSKTHKSTLNKGKTFKQTSLLSHRKCKRYFKCIFNRFLDYFKLSERLNSVLFSSLLSILSFSFPLIAKSLLL